jgi:hypothetical protein
MSVDLMGELRSSVFASLTGGLLRDQKVEVDTFTHAVDLHRLPLPGSLELDVIGGESQSPPHALVCLCTADQSVIGPV